MAKFCIVAPLSILEPLDSLDIIGGNHLLLAHDIVKNADNKRRYRGIFNNPERHLQGKSLRIWEHVILDNSVIELGSAVNTDMIFEAMETVRPHCIVLPDVLEECQATIESCTKAVNTWPELLDKKYDWANSKLRDMPFLYVPQGKTLKEFAKAAEALASNERVLYWGVPRNLVKNIKTRRDAIGIVRAINNRRYIHMMGFSDDLLDDVLSAQICEADTIDSAVPIRYQGKFSIMAEPGPRGNWWDNAVYNSQVRDNIFITRKLFA